jgi:transposase
MMGQQCRSESLFYYFRIEDHVPEDHLLRAIDRYVNFDFVREKLKPFYSETGRPSIDPERLLRILLIGYLYGVTSERKLIEELRMHLAWRWFTGLTFDQEVPHHSTFSKNRHGRFQESGIFKELFEEIVERCVESGLVQGDHLSVDGSFIHADANNGSRIARERLREIAQVNRNVRQYLDDLQRENPVEAEPHQQDKVSTTDPDAAYFSKGDKAPTLGYFDNYLMDKRTISATLNADHRSSGKFDMDRACARPWSLTLLLYDFARPLGRSRNRYGQQRRIGLDQFAAFQGTPPLEHLVRGHTMCPSDLRNTCTWLHRQLHDLALLSYRPPPAYSTP